MLKRFEGANQFCGFSFERQALGDVAPEDMVSSGRATMLDRKATDIYALRVQSALP